MFVGSNQYRCDHCDHEAEPSLEWRSLMVSRVVKPATIEWKHLCSAECFLAYLGTEGHLL